MSDVINKSEQKLHRRNILYFFLFLILSSILLWKFDDWLKWQWLINHSNRLSLKIASQLVLLCIALLMISKNKTAKITEVSLIVAVASLIIPLLSTSEKNHEAKPPNPIIDTSSKPLQPKQIHNDRKSSFKRTIFLSGRIIDVISNSPLDSVAIMINYTQVGYSNNLGIFKIQYQPNQYSGTTTLQFMKRNYEPKNENIITSVKNADVYIDDQLIELKKIE